MVEARQRALAGSLTGFLRDRGSRIGMSPAASEMRAAVNVAICESGQSVPRTGDDLDNIVAPPPLVAQLLIYMRAVGRMIGATEAAREILRAADAAAKACGFASEWQSKHVLTSEPIAVLPDHVVRGYRKMLRENHRP